MGDNFFSQQGIAYSPVDTFKLSPTPVNTTFEVDLMVAGYDHSFLISRKCDLCFERKFSWKVPTCSLFVAISPNFSFRSPNHPLARA
jgi:hypothetical protein